MLVRPHTKAVGFSQEKPKPQAKVAQENKQKIGKSINYFRRIRKTKQFRTIKTVKRSNKLGQALSLPKVLNLNPRSIYNKIDEYLTFIEEKEIDITFMSETWEREGTSLKDIVKADDVEVLSNVHQRTGKGGRPALVVKKDKYFINDLTNTEISIPWGVEAVWGLLTPKNVTSVEKIKKIIIGSIYCKPQSKKKSVLLDHIHSVFNQMTVKHGSSVQWIIAGDTNDLKIEKILEISEQFKQVVTKPTRGSKVLDPIITTLHSFYQEPQVLAPLDSDPDKNGTKSDHNMVTMTPVDVVNNKTSRTKRTITVRPMKESGIDKLSEWLNKTNWDFLAHIESAHEMADTFEQTLKNKIDELLPTKEVKVASDDKPWYTSKLDRLNRIKQREYNKNRKSAKWKLLKTNFDTEVKREKKNFYNKKVAGLKSAKSGQWYKELKKITSFEQHKSENPQVTEISHLPDQEQAELIADKFAQVSQEYDEVKVGDVKIPEYSHEDIPIITETKVKEYLDKVNVKPSQVENDIPAKLVKRFSQQLAPPLCTLINTVIRKGQWPNRWKHEIVTPVPKEFPPKNIGELRPISGLPIFDKVSEKIVAELIVDDMKENLDPKQFSNQKGLSTQHYLIQLIHRILTAVDGQTRNESVAVIATLIDWKEAFSRQCPKLGIASFVNNGVRPSLIPTLTNYLQNRDMTIKWHGCQSKTRKINGGGPQGATFGIWEYLSQSNENANCVDRDDRFKFMDDLTILELVNLTTIAITQYNMNDHVPSDISSDHNQFIHPSQLKSQENLEKINNWTKTQKMKLNTKKTKNMIFNFTTKKQFNTRMKLDDEIVETVSSTKLLGTIITNDLKWNLNTASLVKKANARMVLLRNVASFTKNRDDLSTIYKLFIRSTLETNSCVWHSQLTQENTQDLERIQKSAFKVILGKDYESYESAQNILKLDSLEDRRKNLSLKFASKCIENNKTKNMFPLKTKRLTNITRHTEKFTTTRARTKRLQVSAIPYMEKLLNHKEEENKKYNK